MELREGYNDNLPSSEEVKALRIEKIRANLKRLGSLWRNNKENLPEASINELLDVDLSLNKLVKDMEKALVK